VEAKTVFYEINGQRYSYDTNNRQQTATARKRIEAAKTAEAATAQAAAERASNPLVALFGSQTQREAEAAQAQLQQIVAEQEAAAGKRQPAVQATKDDSVAKPANGQAGETSVNERESAAAAAIAATQPAAVHPIAQDLRDPADPARPEGLSRAAIRLISLDAETGIKTVIRVDGSIHEELFDPSVLSTLDPAPRSVGSTRKAIGANQSPKVSPDEMTGSTSVRELTLGRHAGTDPRDRPLSN
jgi:NADH dehydrogenase/NADH:ubiquinone oxidoreductase subunit G